jgi:hypothetical protein
VSYPKKILKLRPTRGIASDLPTWEVGQDFYTGGANVQFRKGFAGRIGGSRSCYTQNTANPVMHLLNVRAPGGVTQTNFWLAFGTAAIKAEETSNITDITGSALSTVSSPWQWASTLLNNIPCFTNGLDAPRYWGGNVGTPAAALAGWPVGSVCKSLVAFRFHLFALDIDGASGHFESQILWSDAAAPGAVPTTWTPAASNQAGSAILADTPGPCMCGVPLRDSLLIFKRSSLYAVSYVGGNDVFSVRLLDGARGALTRHAVADIGGRIFVVTDGDIALTDGTNWQSVAQGRMKDFLFGQLDQANYENLFVVYHRAKNEVWVCFPESGSTYCTKALVYDVANDAFGVRDLSAVTCAEVGIVNDTSPSEAWDVDAGTWDTDLTYWNAANYSLATEQLVVGANSATLTLQDTADAVSVNAALSRYDLDFGDRARVKFLKRIHVHAAPSSGVLSVRAGARMDPNDPVSWSTIVNLDTSTDQVVNCFAQGRYISVEVSSSGTPLWVLSGLDLEAELRGYF